MNEVNWKTVIIKLGWYSLVGFFVYRCTLTHRSFEFELSPNKANQMEEK